MKRATYLALLLAVTECTAGVPAGGEVTRGETDGGRASDAGVASPPEGRPDTRVLEPVVEGAVVISEIMYHPVLENAAEDNHEFVEIHNRSDAAVALGGWKLAGEISYEFPAGTSIGARQYRVVAKNPSALAAVSRYRLEAADLLGGYTGELDNGDGVVELRDGSDKPVSRLIYSDEFPWPVAADALGAGEKYLAKDLHPLMSHQYMGCSLERVSLDVDAAEVSNWTASPLDGATPGRQNAGAGTPVPIVIEQRATGKEALIKPTDTVKVSARFSTTGTVKDVAVEYFVDVPGKTDEKVMSEPATLVNGEYVAMLPPQPESTIVRYRIVGDRKNGKEVISPRPLDPQGRAISPNNDRSGWWSTFVNPTIATKSRVYHLFVAPTDWDQLYKNVLSLNKTVSPGNPSCTSQLEPWHVLTCTATKQGLATVNTRWQDTVPATFVYDGKVYDVHTRFTSSGYNRLRGEAIATWTVPGPTLTPAQVNPPNAISPTNTCTGDYGKEGPLRALGWKVDMAGYNAFEGRGETYLTRHNCTGVEYYVMGALMREAGVPAGNIKYARLYINGAYFNYIAEFEGIDEDLLKKTFKGEKVGDLFKSDGFGSSDPSGSGVDGDRPGEVGGWWGPGGGSVLLPACGFTAAQRYDATYKPETNKWKTTNGVQSLVEGLKRARDTSDPVVLKKYLEDNFDVDSMLRYIAVRSWSGAWDQLIHNFYLYKRVGGKWMVIGWDWEWELGLRRQFYNYFFASDCGYDGCYKPDISLYLGRKGERGNRDAEDFNVFYDSFFKVFDNEFRKTMHDLNCTTLTPENLQIHIDSWSALYDVSDHMARPGQGERGKPCPYAQITTWVKNWATARHDFVAKTLGACP